MSVALKIDASGCNRKFILAYEAVLGSYKGPQDVFLSRSHGQISSDQEAVMRPSCAHAFQPAQMSTA